MVQIECYAFNVDNLSLLARDKQIDKARDFIGS